MLIKGWRFLRRWWWACVVGIAAVFGGVAAILLRTKPRASQQYWQLPRKTFKELAQEQVERVRLEGEIEKARVNERAEIQYKELDEIEMIGKDNPVEGRRHLARWLSQNL